MSPDEILLLLLIPGSIVLGVAIHNIFRSAVLIWEEWRRD